MNVISMPESLNEALVEAYRVSVTYEEESALVKIAEALLESGRISGYTVLPVVAGYISNDRQSFNNMQYQLDILVKKKDAAENLIRQLDAEIKKLGWQATNAASNPVLVTESMITFIRNADVQHQKYYSQKRVNRTITCIVIVLASLFFLTCAELYAKKREAAANNAAHQRVQDLQKKFANELNRHSINMPIGNADGQPEYVWVFRKNPNDVLRDLINNPN